MTYTPQDADAIRGAKIRIRANAVNAAKTRLIQEHEDEFRGYFKDLFRIGLEEAGLEMRPASPPTSTNTSNGAPGTVPKEEGVEE